MNPCGGRTEGRKESLKWRRRKKDPKKSKRQKRHSKRDVWFETGKKLPFSTE
jgi:hypothetical protein